MRLQKLIAWQFVFLLLFVVCPAVHAQNGAYTSPADLDLLVQTAHTIVRGRVMSAKVESHPQFPNIQTVVVTLSVTKVLKGEAASTFTFRQFLWDAHDLPVFAGYKGAGEVLFFLNPVSPYGLTSPVGLEQGRFRVIRDAKGNRYVLNGRGNSDLFNQVSAKASSRGLTFSRQVREMLLKPTGQAPLNALEDAIQTLVGAPK